MSKVGQLYVQLKIQPIDLNIRLDFVKCAFVAMISVDLKIFKLKYISALMEIHFYASRGPFSALATGLEGGIL